MPIQIPTINFGSLKVQFLTPSGWSYDTDHGVATNYGFFNLVGAGIGGGRLTVKQTRPGLPNTGKRYRMAYTQTQVAFGTPWFIPVTAGGALEIFPANAIGPVFRLPGAPDSSGEGGRPTGFEGVFNMVTVEAAAGAAYNINMLLMGSHKVLGHEVPGSFKYVTFFRGWGANSTASVSVTGIGGRFFASEERND